jgi:iron(III) transport system substrate-binding protein
MAAGAGILQTADSQDEAQRFIEFMLSPVAQQYFATQTFEYPLVEGVVTYSALPPLSELNAAEVDLTNLADMQGTVTLLREEGILP